MEEGSSYKYGARVIDKNVFIAGIFKQKEEQLREILIKTMHCSVFKALHEANLKASKVL